MSNRIYLVTNEQGEEELLVRAASASQAINAITKGRFKAGVATQDDLVRLSSKGAKVIEAAQA
jgi:hypothetical protein